MRRAGKPVAKARGQSARRSVRTICSLERADMPLAETRTRSARRQADDCIQWGTAQYGGLHKFHQISFSYGQTILLHGYCHTILLIYSSVGYSNLSHQVIEDSSQHNHFNNSYGTVCIPQILFCINCIPISFDFFKFSCSYISPEFRTYSLI
jgi:hypothetical protein